MASRTRPDSSPGPRDDSADGLPGPDAQQAVEITRLLVVMSDAVREAIAEVLREFDLTPSVSGVLWALDPAAAPPTMRDVATRLGCDPSTVSLTADKLAATGLVARQPHPEDGRKRTLVLTESGRELWTAIGARLAEVAELSRLDSAERTALAGLLTKAVAPETPAARSGAARSARLPR